MASYIARRKFLATLGGAAAAWPLAARAQQREQMRRIGMLMPLPVDDPQSQRRAIAFLQGLQKLGWTDGRNVRIDSRWGAFDADSGRQYASEMVALAPDVIVAAGASVMGPLQEATRSIPIVFLQVTDPVGAGYVASLARPGGNATGFTMFEFGIGVKWLELLKQIAPLATRVAVLRDPTVPAGLGLLGAIQSVAPSLGVELSPLGVQDANEIEHAVAAFGHGSNNGLIVLPGRTVVYRDLIIALAARHRLPTIYPYRYYVTSGGLISYGPDDVDQYRLAAGYVDRILKGEKPADLPVQAPVKYEMVINLKTAKALGVDLPAIVLARADEVIE